MNSKPCRQHAIACGLTMALLAAGCSGATSLRTQAARRLADALYTAATSRRMELIVECERTLDRLVASDELSASEADALRRVIILCERKEWQTAAEQLSAMLTASS